MGLSSLLAVPALHFKLHRPCPVTARPQAVPDQAEREAVLLVDILPGQVLVIMDAVRACPHKPVS